MEAEVDPVTRGTLIDARLPDDSRLHALIPDIARRHWSSNTRSRDRDRSQAESPGGMAPRTRWWRCP